MPYSALSQHQSAQFPAELAVVRGYEVRTRDDDEKVGKVDHLICSPDGSVRYFDVDLGGFFNPRHVALPTGAARVNRANDVVWSSAMSSAARGTRPGTLAAAAPTASVDSEADSHARPVADPRDFGRGTGGGNGSWLRMRSATGGTRTTRPGVAPTPRVKDSTASARMHHLYAPIAPGLTTWEVVVARPVGGTPRCLQPGGARLRHPPGTV